MVQRHANSLKMALDSALRQVLTSEATIKSVASPLRILGLAESLEPTFDFAWTPRCPHFCSKEGS